MPDNGIVCFAGNDWWVHNPLTEKQWMRQLSLQGHTVLFVNSIGIGMPGLDSPHMWKRLRRKIQSMLRWLRQSEDVWVLTPVMLPFWSFAPVRILNVFLITLQVRWAMKRAGMTRPLFWAGLPTGALFTGRIPHHGVLYYVQDNFTAYYDSMRFTRHHEDHATMLATADAVVCASIGMADRIRADRDGVHYIPHGVHPAFFSVELEETSSTPPELEGIPHPIIGYWGSLEILQDKELIRTLALRHPEWSFVFIGRQMADLDDLAALPNVHYTGYIPLEHIPRIGVHFDVGWISWTQTEWAAYSCPVKLREYLAMGLPVVTPYIVEVEKAYDDEGLVARNHEEFDLRLQEALTQGDRARRMHRRELVRNETWEYSARRVHYVILGLEETP
jgi:glycosyltransferase involved in cell wall biosynthesis